MFRTSTTLIIRDERGAFNGQVLSETFVVLPVGGSMRVAAGAASTIEQAVLIAESYFRQYGRPSRIVRTEQRLAAIVTEKSER